MIDDRNDPNRPLNSDPDVNRPVATDSAAMGWGIPLAVAAVVLVAGLLFFNNGRVPDRTATNSTAVTQTNPSGPARPAPAPQPAPTR
jgi:hypothetical protein